MSDLGATTDEPDPGDAGGTGSHTPGPCQGMQAHLCFVQNETKSAGPHNHRSFGNRSQSQQQGPVATTEHSPLSDRSAGSTGPCPPGCWPVPGWDGGHASPCAASVAARQASHRIEKLPVQDSLSLSLSRRKKDFRGFLLAEYGKVKKKKKKNNHIHLEPLLTLPYL